MRALVERTTRLKVTLTRELQTTVSYLRYHFNQRDMFDKKMQAHHLYHHGVGLGLGDEAERRRKRERKLEDQKPLKMYGQVDEKEEDYSVMKPPTQ